MIFKKIKFFIVAATFGCSLFLFSCSGDKKTQEQLNEEEQEMEDVEKMLENDKAKSDSMKNELLKEE